MDIAKIFLDKYLSNISKDTFAIKYWDNDRKIYGDGEPQFTIVFKEPIPKKKILNDPSLAFGEAYMDGIIEVEGNLRETLEAVYRNKDSFLNKPRVLTKLSKIVPTSIDQQKEDIHHHYDLGNDFYKLWLDETLSYSCGYFKTKDDSLYQAQLNKIHHILEKLHMKEGDRLLDIGSGWGWLIIEAAKLYGVYATGITLSKEQYDKTRERIVEEGLEDKVEVKLMDYRELADTGEKFDRVVSVGMMEHVGRANIPVYMETVKKLLVPHGVSILHCITGQVESEGNLWINKYIFPGGFVPTIRELVAVMPDFDFHLVDVESLRLHYYMTLKHWSRNFDNSLDEVRKMYDERFIRMWKLYLDSCAASFHYGVIDVHQFLFTKGLNNDLPMVRVS